MMVKLFALYQGCATDTDIRGRIRINGYGYGIFNFGRIRMGYGYMRYPYPFIRIFYALDKMASNSYSSMLNFDIYMPACMQSFFCLMRLVSMKNVHELFAFLLSVTIHIFKVQFIFNSRFNLIIYSFKSSKIVYFPCGVYYFIKFIWQHNCTINIYISCQVS